MPSPSQSPSSAARGGVAGVGGSSGPTTGEREALVKRLPNFLESTRRRKRVGTGAPLRVARADLSLAGTVSRSSLVVPTSALTKIARPPVRLNTTVFFFRPRRKERPR